MSTATEAQSTQSLALREVYEGLAAIGGQLITDEAVKRGDELIIPHRMTLPEVAEHLLDLEQAEQEMVEIRRVFPYRYYDGLVATERAVRKFFGSLKHKTRVNTFFGKVDVPPRYMDVPIGPRGQTQQVPVGEVHIPAIPGCVLELTAEMDPELGEVYVIFGSVRRKARAAVEGLFMLIEQELRDNSIYKGKAIDGGFNFLDLSRVDMAKVIYAEDVFKHMDAHVLTPIAHGDVLREAEVELKHTLLLHGTYGVGKTLFGYYVANFAESHGVGFIQVRPNQDAISEVLREAQKLSPCVVFVEDIDTLTGPEGEIQHMLELFDGARAKGSEILAILTTNHAEVIHKGMHRPGRIDAQIELTPPDGPGIIRLCKAQIKSDLLCAEDTDEDWDAVAIAAEGYIPAFITEGCKRAVKYAIARAATDQGIDREQTAAQVDLSSVSISALDVAAAMEGLRSQWLMMQEASDEVVTHHLDELVTGLVSNVVASELELTFPGRRD